MRILEESVHEDMKITRWEVERDGDGADCGGDEDGDRDDIDDWKYDSKDFGRRSEKTNLASVHGRAPDGHDAHGEEHDDTGLGIENEGRHGSCDEHGHGRGVALAGWQECEP
jgi:hypothetical protein